jgi:hypothetical protein
MAAAVGVVNGTLRVGTPTVALSRRVADASGAVLEYRGSTGNSGPNFDVLADGRFVVLRGPAGDASPREIALVQHWLPAAPSGR